MNRIVLQRGCRSNRGHRNFWGNVKPLSTKSGSRNLYNAASATDNIIRKPMTLRNYDFNNLSLFMTKNKSNPSLLALLTTDCRHFSSSNNVNHEIECVDGEEYYSRALQAMEQMKQMDLEEEEARAAQQFEAMQKSFQRSDGQSLSSNRKNDRAAGVAVVRTITRQTRTKLKEQQQTEKHQKETIHENDNKIMIDETNSSNRTSQKTKKDLAKEAKYFMQKAAFQHSHTQALIRLGNEAYQEAYELLNNKDAIITHYHPEFVRNNSQNSVLDVEFLERANPIHRAVYLYETAGEKGSSTEAWYNLGNLFWNGYNNNSASTSTATNKELKTNNGDDILEICTSHLPIDLDVSMAAFYRAIDLGDNDAKYFVGVSCLWSDDTTLLSHIREKNYNTAKKNNLDDIRRHGLNLIEEAAGAGHEGALHYLALYYRNGDERLNIPSCTEDEFRIRLDAAADAGDADAIFLRAHCHFHGEDGYEQDYKEALDGYLRAADAGNDDAAISAGAMYHKGGFNGTVIQNKRRAFELYQEAAEMGNKEGWRNLVSCYALGEGVPECKNTAKYIAKTMLQQ